MAWLMVPDLIFSDIMMKVGFDSLDRLHSCRRVCKAWNEMILRDVCQSRKNRKIMRERIEKIWGLGMLPTNEEISEAKWAVSGGILDLDRVERLTEQVGEIFEDGAISMDDISKLICGASMVHNDLLDFDSWMNPMRISLQNIDLSPVPIQHLESLAYCVTGDVEIKNVSGCQQIVSILKHIYCASYLRFSNQSLGREETQALVQAMESGVGVVVLLREVTLDIKTFTEYSGQGFCWEVSLRKDTAAKYREELRTWARIRNWRVGGAGDCFRISRS